jgi:HSP20 family protein
MTTNVNVREETKKEMTVSPKQAEPGAELTRPGRVFSPAVDIFENDAAITVLADMPGVRSEDLTIDLRESVLSITGVVHPVEGANERTLVAEYDTGSFCREFRLSSVIDQGKIDAALHDGVLRLTLPKAEAARPRKIQVRG